MEHVKEKALYKIRLKGSFTYDVHDLGGRAGLRFCDTLYQRIFFEFKICDKRGGGWSKIPFFDGRHK